MHLQRGLYLARVGGRTIARPLYASNHMVAEALLFIDAYDGLLGGGEPLQRKMRKT